METKTIAASICRDLIVDEYEVAGERMIAARATYPNGDHICAYVSDQTTGMWFTDYGTTIDRIERAGVKLTKSRNEFVKSTTTRFGLKVEDRVLSMPVDPGQPGASFAKFCEAVGVIASLEYDAVRNRATGLPTEVDYTIEDLLQSVGSSISVVRRWNDHDQDPEQLWPVDWRLEGKTTLHVYAVQSQNRIPVVAATENFLRAHNIKNPTLTVCAKEISFGDKQFKRLRQVATRVITGFGARERQDFRQWIVSRIAT